VVDERQATVVLEVDRLNSSIHWQRSGSISTMKTQLYCSLSDVQSVFMPCLSDNEHIEVIISDSDNNCDLIFESLEGRYSK